MCEKAFDLTSSSKAKLTASLVGLPRGPRLGDPCDATGVHSSSERRVPSQETAQRRQGNSQRTRTTFRCCAVEEDAQWDFLRIRRRLNAREAHQMFSQAAVWKQNLPLKDQRDDPSLPSPPRGPICALTGRHGARWGCSTKRLAKEG